MKNKEGVQGKGIEKKIPVNGTSGNANLCNIYGTEFSKTNIFMHSKQFFNKIYILA